MNVLFSTLALSALLAAPLAAQAGARRAAPSTRAITEVSLTLVDTAAQRAAGKPALMRIDYGQPHLRGRKINTDSLVPIGTVWRLGANAATLFTTDVDLTIVHASLLMARRLGLSTVAEGVSNSEQVRLLASLGCELFQGHLYSPPVSAEKFEAMLRLGFIIPDEPEQ
jgi:uncharacterized membrane protein YgdD (TMEM256/DUF423 family)